MKWRVGFAYFTFEMLILILRLPRWLAFTITWEAFVEGDRRRLTRQVKDRLSDMTAHAAPRAGVQGSFPRGRDLGRTPSR